MRVSAIADWTTCEAMAISDPHPEARVHVAAWVGTLAHALLSGCLEDTEEPSRLRYDALTPTPHAATVQAHAIVSAASRRLDYEGWSIMESEREMGGNGDTGHLDVLAWHRDTKRSAIIDLKTGQSIGAGWLQVGGYLSLFEKDYRLLADQMRGGILHVPRVSISKEPKATLEVRYAADLMNAWTTAKSRIDAVLAGATPLRSPGQHCGRCTSRCPVRV